MNAKLLTHTAKELSETAADQGRATAPATAAHELTRVGGRVWVEASPGQGAAFYVTVDGT